MPESGSTSEPAAGSPAGPATAPDRPGAPPATPPPDRPGAGPATAPVSRPAAVSAASLLLLLAAAAVLTDAVVGFVHAGAVTAAFRQAYAGVDIGVSEVNIVVAGGVLVLLATGLVTLALLNRRGRARLHTWMLGGLAVCYGGSSMATERSLPRGAPDPELLRRLLDQAVPEWVDALTRVTIAVAVVAVGAAMVLLAVPPANRYFRDSGTRTGGPRP